MVAVPWRSWAARSNSAASLNNIIERRPPVQAGERRKTRGGRVSGRIQCNLLVHFALLGNQWTVWAKSLPCVSLPLPDDRGSITARVRRPDTEPRPSGSGNEAPIIWRLLSKPLDAC